jgi:hypothetical protein
MFECKPADDLRTIAIRQFPIDNDSDRTDRTEQFEVQTQRGVDGGREFTFQVGPVLWKCTCNGLNAIHRLLDNRGEQQTVFQLFELVDLAAGLGWELALVSCGAIPGPSTLQEYRDTFCRGVKHSRVIKKEIGWIVRTPSGTEHGPYEEQTAQTVCSAFDLADEAGEGTTNFRSSNAFQRAAEDLEHINGTSIATRRLRRRAEELRQSEDTWK